MQSGVVQIQQFLSRHRVVTLCVMENSGLPWCASCYYTFQPEEMTLYLLSALDTRHGAGMRQNSSVVGTVAGQPCVVQQIQGIQYQGHIRLLEGVEAQDAMQRYQQRFPIARQKQAPIWSLAFSLIKMTDNQAGFGTKWHWQRDTLNGLDA